MFDKLAIKNSRVLSEALNELQSYINGTEEDQWTL